MNNLIYTKFLLNYNYVCILTVNTSTKYLGWIQKTIISLKKNKKSFIKCVQKTFLFNIILTKLFSKTI